MIHHDKSCHNEQLFYLHSPSGKMETKVPSTFQSFQKHFANDYCHVNITAQCEYLVLQYQKPN